MCEEHEVAGPARHAAHPGPGLLLDGAERAAGRGGARGQAEALGGIMIMIKALGLDETGTARHLELPFKLFECGPVSEERLGGFRLRLVAITRSWSASSGRGHLRTFSLVIRLISISLS